ncbi:DNA mismatch repair endonuclease MutL [Zavarzinia compransoris]|uniref:DNA mismatch repair protein MutL n=1 Tax=Zavarzinia compransoris TaxID=1264899 RepID=A0A317EBB0_9PROT|nr:DNA mismatch repair endonuclease MutL [Zavarzinia compransoris]PWR23554.1 DNA mismatch repair endonuclease MutL [Zavarzinia compransoris]
MRIRLLSESTVNRIAAGEVVERPASAVKELVENAIDAGASRIDVVVEGGGRALIRVADDGFGMSAGELALAIERHATSKLPDDDLDAISSFGFRGEALPSIGAVARLDIASRARGAAEGWMIRVEGGLKHPLEPAAIAAGTRVEVHDLFYATPARLKFLKSEQAEYQAIADVMRRLALAHPAIGFSLADGARVALRFPPETTLDPLDARRNRIAAVIGRDFADNALAIAAEREGVRLEGFASLPTYARATAAHQYLFVNGRPVKDKLLTGAVRGAYADFLARDRHPAIALYLTIDGRQVDVNVHPAKAEVRFRDPGLVRGLIVGALRHALGEAGHRASTTVAGAALGSFRPAELPSLPARSPGFAFAAPPRPNLAERSAAYAFQAPPDATPGVAAMPSPQAPAAAADEGLDRPLGVPRGQLHLTYIVAETRNGLVLVDQHAAHERLVYERMKKAIESEGGVKRQALLIPEVVDLDGDGAARIAAKADDLAELGLVVEAFGHGAVVVREVPALLGRADVPGLVRDLADEIAELGDGFALREKLAEVCGTLACHSAVRAGRRLTYPEMDALLREMEATPHSGQCNHGRPTYVELKLPDIERLFGRR